MRFFKILFITSLNFLIFQNIYADTYKIDPAHSVIQFSIRHLLSDVEGNFKEFSGQYDLNEKTSEVSNVQFSISADSINTQNEKRDTHLRTEEFFETNKYKTIDTKFPEKIKLKKDRPVTVKVMTTMHGVTREIPFTLTYLGVAKDPWKNVVSAFKAQAKINRKDFNIIWNKTLDNGKFLLGDSVAISITIEGQKQKDAK